MTWLTNDDVFVPVCADRVYLPMSSVRHQCSMARKNSLPLRDVVRAWYRWAVQSGWTMQGDSHVRVFLRCRPGPEATQAISPTHARSVIYSLCGMAVATTRSR